MDGQHGAVGLTESQDARIGHLENAMSDIQTSLAKLLSQQEANRGRSAATGSEPAPRKGALRHGSRPANISSPYGDRSDLRVSFPGLDASVAQAALNAGVNPEQLGEASALLKGQPRRMEDIPRPSQSKWRNELSESEDEEDEEDLADGGSGSSSADPGMTKVLAKITKVCKVLAEQRPKNPNSLETLLDQAQMTGGSSDGFGSGGSRRNAQALRALRRCLTENPEVIYGTLESNLLADFSSRPARPGDPMGAATVRGWLESRSRVLNYTNHVRWMWSVAGIWDCLIRNDVGGARARAGLLIAAGEQASIDGGSWLLSNVSLLEAPPPYHSFANHQSPNMQELQHSALFDSRWVELFLSHVKELDSYQETRKKLSRQSPSKSDTEEKPNPKSKPKAKPKGAGKGKEYHDKSNKSSEAETASP